MFNPSCIYFCLMQREGALQSLCQLVNERMIPKIAQTYHAIVELQAYWAAGVPERRK
jgi:hypothetical protein